MYKIFISSLTVCHQYLSTFDTRTVYSIEIFAFFSIKKDLTQFLGSEMMQLEDQLSAVRKENEILRIEYEQNLAANEQTGPINKEMRSLITTLQTNNKLLKSDNLRTKKRLQELQDEYDKYKNEQKEKIDKLQQTSSTDSAEPLNTSQNHQIQCSDYESLKKSFEFLMNLNLNDDEAIKSYLKHLTENQGLLRTLIETHLNGTCVIGKWGLQIHYIL